MASPSPASGPSGRCPGRPRCLGSHLRAGNIVGAIETVAAASTCDVHALYALKDLAKAVKTERTADLAISVNGPQAILKWLRPHDVSEDLLVAALDALVAIALGNPLSTWPVDAARRCQKQICTLLTAHTTKTELAFGGCSVLAVLHTSTIGTSGAFGRGGTLDVVLAVLRANIRNVDVCRRACSALAALAGDEPAADRVVAAGAVEVVVEALQLHSRSSPLGEALSALVAFSDCTHDVMPAVVSPATVKAVIEISTRFRGTTHHADAASAIAFVVTSQARSPGGAAHSLELGVVHEMLALMKDKTGSELVPLCASALHFVLNARRDGAIEDLMLRSGAVTPLVAALRSGEMTPDYHFPCLKALAAVIVHDGEACRILDAGVASLLVKLSKPHAVPSAQGYDLLPILSIMAKCGLRGAQALAGAGALPLLVAAVRKLVSASAEAEVEDQTLRGSISGFTLEAVQNMATVLPAAAELLLRLGSIEDICNVLEQLLAYPELDSTTSSSSHKPIVACLGALKPLARLEGAASHFAAGGERVAKTIVAAVQRYSPGGPESAGSGNQVLTHFTPLSLCALVTSAAMACKFTFCASAATAAVLAAAIGMATFAEDLLAAGAAPALVKVLQRATDASDARACIGFTQGLATLLLSCPLDGRCCAAGAGEAVIASLRRFPYLTIVDSTTVLAQVSLLPGASKRLIRDGGAEVVVRVFSPTLDGYSCEVIRNIAAEEGCRAELMRAGAAKAIVAGIRDLAKKSMHRGISTPELSAICCAAVRNLAMSPGNRQVLMGEGCAEVVASTLALCTSEPLAWAACGALFALACDPTAVLSIRRGMPGIGNAVAIVMEEMPRSARLAWVVCGLIYKVTAPADAGAKVLLLRDFVAERVLRALTIHASDARVVRAACGALANLAASLRDEADGKAASVLAKARDAVQSALARHSPGSLAAAEATAAAAALKDL